MFYVPVLLKKMGTLDVRNMAIISTMAEFHVNDYVVEVEGGHPGRRSYNLIATPETWKRFSRELNFVLEEKHLSQNIKKNERGERMLLSKYATISKGQTSRVEIAFYAADDLSAHHVPPGFWQRFYDSWIGCWLGFAIVAAILVLAVVGTIDVVGHLRSLF